jgi:hypothetical protein
LGGGISKTIFIFLSEVEKNCITLCRQQAKKMLAVFLKISKEGSDKHVINSVEPL